MAKYDESINDLINDLKPNVGYWYVGGSRHHKTYYISIANHPELGDSCISFETQGDLRNFLLENKYDLMITKRLK